MALLEKMIGLWLRAAAVLFAAAVLLLCGLLVIFNLWLVPLGLVVIAVIHWQRCQEDRSEHTPDLIDKIGAGVTGLLLLFVAGIALVLGLAIALRHPWLILLGLTLFWLWRRSQSRRQT